MNIQPLPQLRVLVTDYCDSKCIYCRPSGEGNLECLHQNMKYETAKNAAKLYRASGGREIKISGGDPVFWPHLCDYIHALKYDMNYEHVELITRSARIAGIVDQLVDEHLDILNFSLDSICPQKYYKITGKSDFDIYIQTIVKSAAKLFCKINMVVLGGTTFDEISDMIRFCIKHGIRELKLLDYIDDLTDEPSLSGADQAELFQFFYKRLEEISVEKRIISQGGLGHPMMQFTVSDTFRITCKDASQGAWYGPDCPQCPHYPCHDALMALRITPNDSFQLCLLNSRMHWKFDHINMEKQLQSILSIYRNANFIGSNANENNCSDPP